MRRHVAFGAALVLAAAGCASLPDYNADFSEDAAIDLFATAYDDVADKYVEVVPISSLAIEGMRGLTAIDPGWSVTKEGDYLALHSSRGQMRIKAPPEGDSEGWAAATVTAIRADRQASPDMSVANRERIYEAVMDGALSVLDSSSRYSPPDEAQDQHDNHSGFGGVGFRFQLIDGKLTVISVLPFSPGEAGGLRAGDNILAIDNQHVDGLARRDAVRLLRGPVDSAVTLTVTRNVQTQSQSQSYGQTMTLTLHRAMILAHSVLWRRDGDVAIIQLTGFNRDTASGLARAIEESRSTMGHSLKGVVLDLRGNPGGLLDQAVAVSDMLLGRGNIVSTRGRNPDSDHIYDATGIDRLKGLPMVVLINGRSASAAEIVAAALQDNGRAVVAGTTSYGKGTVQTVLRLPNDGELVLTWSHFHAPSGYPLQGLGVMPTVCTATSGKSRIASPLAFADWRAAGQADRDRRQALRAACAPRTEIPDSDIAIAHLLLENHPLYAEALQVAAPLLASGEGARHQ